MIWLCRKDDAYVGCHKNSKDHAPLGRLANAELRSWKQRAHAAFDPLWQRKQAKEECSSGCGTTVTFTPLQLKEAVHRLDRDGHDEQEFIFLMKCIEADTNIKILLG